MYAFQWDEPHETVMLMLLNSLVIGDLPQTSGVVEYTNGTLFTDDFFNIPSLGPFQKDTAAHTLPDQYKLYQVATLDIQTTQP